MRRTTPRKYLACRDVCSGIGFVDYETQKTLGRMARRLARRRPLAWCMGAVLLILCVMAMCLYFFSRHWFFTDPWFLILLLPVIQTCSFLLHYHNFRHARHWLADELYRRGIRPRVCFCCDYPLRRIASDRCPECGQALAPPEPRWQELADQVADEPEL
jgi:hypothetical protein